MTDDASPDGLRRGLNLFGAVSMIVGIVIGSGIFLGVNRVAAGTGSPALIVLVWVIAGFLTLMGALTYAELGTMFPRAGGEYVFLSKALGPLTGFLSGWTAFTVNLAGSSAALGLVFAAQLDALKPIGFESVLPGDWSQKVTAVALIAVLSIVNYFGLKYGGAVQKTLTVGKGLLMVGLTIAAFAYMGDAASPTVGFFDSTEVPNTPSDAGPSLAGFLGLAMIAALFAFDGWTNVVRVGSEIQNPSRNIPRAMVLGISAIAALYILISFGYLKVLGFEGFAAASNLDLGGDRTVASNAAAIIFGDFGRSLVAAMILVSVLGSLNGIILSGPRIYFAMSRAGFFPKAFGKVSRHQTPGFAILAQSALSIVFLLFFNFEELTDNVIFISFFFYGLAAVGLIVLRRRMPDAERPYKVPLYPVVPILYILSSMSFVAYLLYDQIATLSLDNLNRLAGVLVVAAGVPVYFYYKRKQGAVLEE